MTFIRLYVRLGSALSYLFCNVKRFAVGLLMQPHAPIRLSNNRVVGFLQTLNQIVKKLLEEIKTKHKQLNIRRLKLTFGFL